MDIKFLQVKPQQNGQNIDLWLCHGTVCGKSPGTYPDVTLNPGSGPHTFIVSITDPTLGVTFADDPMWIKPSHGSPPNHMWDSAGQIPPLTKANNTTIFFTDQNNNDPSNGWLTLGYALRFNTPNGVLSIDPDIKNGGGTSTAYTTLQVAEFGITAATLLTLIFVALRQESIRQMVAGIVNWTRSK
jgi:hypothetical protein